MRSSQTVADYQIQMKIANFLLDADSLRLSQMLPKSQKNLKFPDCRRQSATRSFALA